LKQGGGAQFGQLTELKILRVLASTLQREKRLLPRIHDLEATRSKHQLLYSGAVQQKADQPNHNRKAKSKSTHD
jgi:hypothetical protein